MTEGNREIDRLMGEALADQAAYDADLSAENEEGSEEGGQRLEVPPEQLREMMVGSMAMASKAGFAMIAPAWDDISMQEHALVGEGAADMIDYFWPNAASYVGPFGTFLGAVAAIAMPRIQEGRPLRLPDLEEEPENSHPMPPGAMPGTPPAAPAGETVH